MEWKELKIFLKSSDSRNLTKALTQIRSKDLKSQSGIQHLLDQNFISFLVPILERSNKKNIDISLSILANLLQSSMAQTQIRASSGLTKLANIADNIQDRSISISVKAGWQCPMPVRTEKTSRHYQRQTSVFSSVGTCQGQTPVTRTH